MVEEDYKRFDDPEECAKMFTKNLIATIKDPFKVYKKQYQNRPSTIHSYENVDGEARITIVDDANDRVRLNSKITPIEYSTLKDEKSVKEADLLSVCIKQGIVPEKNIRRPYILEGEPDRNYMEETSDGKLQPYEFKEVQANKHKS